MPFRRVAVVCVADTRLRGVCAILLRHAGYRMVEAATVEEAKTALHALEVSILLAGALADPDDQLSTVAAQRNVACVRIAPDLPTEALLKLFESIQPPPISPTRKR